jgi:hypothetical protein
MTLRLCMLKEGRKTTEEDDGEDDEEGYDPFATNLALAMLLEPSVGFSALFSFSNICMLRSRLFRVGHQVNPFISRWMLLL